MIQSIDQLELGLRIKTLKEAVLACRARGEQVKQEEADYLDHLARAEAEVTGKAPGSEGVELSGLIAEGENPHAQATPASTPEGGEPAQSADPADAPATAEPTAQPTA